MVARVRNLRDQGFRRRITHRIPLGLLLLSAGAITSSQLAEALSIQRATGAGRLGELLCKSGITEEYDIAKAISGQWGCPVLKSCSPTLDAARLLPLELLERYRVIPFFYSSDQKTMYLAFAEGIEYPLMSAVERTLDCRTEACLVTPSELDRALNQLRTVSTTSGAVFEQPQTDLEIAATVRSYALQCGATAVCVSNCGEHIWIRIFTTQPLDLLFRISRTP